MASTINVCLILAILIVGSAVPLLIVAAALHLTAVRRKLKWLACTFMVYLVAIVLAFSWWTRPTAIFEMHFGFMPTTDIERLESEHFILGDNGETNLSFAASERTVDRIVRQLFSRKLAASTPDDSGMHHFHRDFSDNFSSESYDLWYYSETGRVRFAWIGID